MINAQDQAELPLEDFQLPAAPETDTWTAREAQPVQDEVWDFAMPTIRAKKKKPIRREFFEEDMI